MNSKRIAFVKIYAVNAKLFKYSNIPNKRLYSDTKRQKEIF